MNIKKKIIFSIASLIALMIVSFCVQTFSAFLYNEPIVKIKTITVEGEQQMIKGTFLNGNQKGQQVKVMVPYQENQIVFPHYIKNQQVFVHDYEIIEEKRDGYVFFIIGLLFWSLVVIGGKTGLRTFMSVLLNAVLLVFIVYLYRTLQGISLLTFGFIYTFLAVVLTLIFIDGIKSSSFQKIIASLLTILLSFGLCYGAMFLLHDKGLRYEELGLLTRPYRPIFLFSLLIGGVGAALDTVVTVISSLEEIEAQHPHTTLKQLYQSGRNIGNDISGTMINVLLCSYFSGAIPVILLYLSNDWQFRQTMKMTLSLEFLRVLCGGFAIVLAIPCALSMFYVMRRSKK